MARPSSARATPPLLRRTTLRDGVYAALRNALMNGAYLPGQRLTVREVAETMRTSTMPVREALRQLTAEGVLVPLASGATRVPEMSINSLRNLTEIRLELEGLAARRATPNLDEAAIAELRELNERWRAASKANKRDEATAANEHFHFKLYEAAGSPELMELIANLWLRVGPFLRFYLDRTPVNANQPPPDTHSELLSALRKRDAQRAEQAIRDDISLGMKFLVGLELD